MATSPLVERFVESMVMNHERWHDGSGYDLEALREANAEESRQIESLLLSRGVRDWRDVEALAALATPEARERLRGVLQQNDEPLKLSLVLHAPEVLSEEEAVGVLLPVLRERGIHDGLTEALLAIEDFHPGPIREALLEGVLHREGPVAYEFAAMLLLIHGKITSVYDMEERPFLLRFHEEDRSAAVRELCERIGEAVPPG